MFVGRLNNLWKELNWSTYIKPSWFGEYHDWRASRVMSEDRIALREFNENELEFYYKHDEIIMDRYKSWAIVWVFKNQSERLNAYAYLVEEWKRAKSRGVYYYRMKRCLYYEQRFGECYGSVLRYSSNIYFEQYKNVKLINAKLCPVNYNKEKNDEIYNLNKYPFSLRVDFKGRHALFHISPLSVDKDELPNKLEIVIYKHELEGYVVFPLTISYAFHPMYFNLKNIVKVIRLPFYFDQKLEYRFQSYPLSIDERVMLILTRFYNEHRSTYNALWRDWMRNQFEATDTQALYFFFACILGFSSILNLYTDLDARRLIGFRRLSNVSLNFFPRDQRMYYIKFDTEPAFNRRGNNAWDWDYPNYDKDGSIYVRQPVHAGNYVFFFPDYTTRITGEKNPLLDRFFITSWANTGVWDMSTVSRPKEQHRYSIDWSRKRLIVVHNQIEDIDWLSQDMPNAAGNGELPFVVNLGFLCNANSYWTLEMFNKRMYVRRLSEFINDFNFGSGFWLNRRYLMFDVRFNDVELYYSCWDGVLYVNLFWDELKVASYQLDYNYQVPYKTNNFWADYKEYSRKAWKVDMQVNWLEKQIEQEKRNAVINGFMSVLGIGSNLATKSAAGVAGAVGGIASLINSGLTTSESIQFKRKQIEELKGDFAYQTYEQLKSNTFFNYEYSDLDIKAQFLQQKIDWRDDNLLEMIYEVNDVQHLKIKDLFNRLTCLVALNAKLFYVQFQIDDPYFHSKDIDELSQGVYMIEDDVSFILTYEQTSDNKLKACYGVTYDYKTS